MPTEGFGAWTEGAELFPYIHGLTGCSWGSWLGSATVTTVPGTECVPTWLCPLAFAGVAISLPQLVWEFLVEQRASECPHRAVVAVSGPLLAPESPSCLVGIIPAASFPPSLHPGSACSCDSSTGWPCPLPLHPCHSSLSPVHSFPWVIIVLIPGSPLCRGRCCCSHQLGSWLGASSTHLHGHEKDWGKKSLQGGEKLPGLFQREEQ